MDRLELEQWFASVRERLESAYLSAEEPWRQSGFSGPVERWVACRQAIADCVNSSGTFLDIGCANGYLLESLVQWTTDRGVRIEPWGLDLSEKLVTLAKERLPDHTANLFVGNALTWQPPRTFDYVRTELCYVPKEYQRQYVLRLVDEFLAPGGRLLVAEYRSRKSTSTEPWVDGILEQAGFAVESCQSGFWQSMELTRVAVLPKPG